MVEKQLSIFLKNKPGVLGSVCRALAEKNITLRGISVSDTVDHAVVRMVVSDIRTATQIFTERGLLVVETDVLGVVVSDEPDALGMIARKLARIGVNIEYAYGSADNSSGIIFFRVSDTPKALKALTPKKKKLKKKA